MTGPTAAGKTLGLGCTACALNPYPGFNLYLGHSEQVIIITGPTAVGKTAVGLELARRLGGEVISADSVQVYRTLDVGSDKVCAECRRGLPT